MPVPRRFGILFPSVGPRRLGFVGITIEPYLLRDEFSDTVPAGSVNGTLATPSGQTRAVVDTNSKFSVGSGVFNVATGAATDDNLHYDSYTREAGRILISKIVVSSSIPTIGWDVNAAGAISLHIRFAASNLLQLTENAGGSLVTVGTYTNATVYYVAYILRASGQLVFIKGGSEYPSWTLLPPQMSDMTASLYPAVACVGSLSVFNVDFIRVPIEKVLFAPLTSDSFNRADGAIGTADGAGTEETAPTATWTGSTYTISSNKAINTPTQGSDLVVNGGFDTDSDWTKGTGWTIGSGVATKTAGAGASVSQTILTAGMWYFITYDLTVSAGSFFPIYGAITGKTRTTSASYIDANRASGTSMQMWGINTFAGTLDNVTVKALTLSSLFSSVSVSSQNVLCSADLTIMAGTQAGVVVCLDSTSSPANFLIGYHDGTNAILDKCVGGTYTNLISAAATYSAGATLTVVKDGNSVNLYYNNVLVGTTQTVSDAGIVSNTKHGLFSTYSGNTFDNFRVWDRKSSYGTLDRFIG